MSDFMSAVDKREERSQGRDATYRRRVAAQQILRGFVPLLARPLREGHDVAAALFSTSFKEDVALSRTLAARVYGLVHGRDPSEVTAAQSRAIRQDVVALVSEIRGKGLPVDVDAIVASVGGAMAAHDAEFGAETMRWADMSDRGSAALTASHATLALWTSVNVYDFRLGVDVALGRCVDAAARAASEGVATVLGDGATREDKRSLTQSLLRDMSRLLSARYEVVARATVDAILALPAASHAGYFARERPFEAMLEKFRVDAEAFVRHVAKATTAQVEAEAEMGAARGYG